MTTVSEVSDGLISSHLKWFYGFSSGKALGRLTYLIDLASPRSESGDQSNWLQDTVE